MQMKTRGGSIAVRLYTCKTCVHMDAALRVEQPHLDDVLISWQERCPLRLRVFPDAIP